MSGPSVQKPHPAQWRDKLVSPQPRLPGIAARHPPCICSHGMQQQGLAQGFHCCSTSLLHPITLPPSLSFPAHTDTAKVLCEAWLCGSDGAQEKHTRVCSVRVQRCDLRRTGLHPTAWLGASWMYWASSLLAHGPSFLSS